MNSWEQADSTFPSAGATSRAGGRPSGRWVVAVMLGFGVVATAGMWLYWELHTRPFRPLQEALVREFPGSNPRVQGGQEKMHRNTPRILQIVMRVGFDPVADVDQARAVADRAADLARRHHDLTPYELIEVGLFQPLAERDPRIRTIRIRTEPALGQGG